MPSWKRTALGLGARALAALAGLRYGWLGQAALPRPVEPVTLGAPGEPDLAAALLPRGPLRLLVVAHGFGKCARWRSQVAMVWAALRRFDVLGIGFRGRGRSDGLADLYYSRAAAVLRRGADQAAGLGYDAVGAAG